MAAAASGLLTSCDSKPLTAGSAPSRRHDEPVSIHDLYRNLQEATPAEASIEYTPDYALWSDGVQKRRWLILPPDSRIDTSDMDHWEFPIGTVAVKEFSIDGLRLETRVIQRLKDTGDLKKDFFMGTFVWNDEQRDAVLLKEGALNVNGTAHDVPAQKLCITCHMGEPSAILGISAVQASRSGLLDVLTAADLLSHPPDRAFLIPGSEVESQAIGTLHANCGHCHSATGFAPTMRLRFMAAEADLPIQETGLYRTTVEQTISNEWLSPPAEYSRRIVPGHPESSAVVFRMSQRGSDNEPAADQMPPLATEQVDWQGVAAVTDWIATLASRLPPGAVPTWLGDHPTSPRSANR